MRKLLLLFMVGTFISAGSSWGEIPRQMNFQGMLTDDTGQPLNGNYKFKFSIYDAPSGGTALWTEHHLGIEVENGLLNLELGKFIPIPKSVFNEPERYLGISVGTYPQLTPRIQLTSVGYAYRALVADSALVAVSASSGGGWTDQGTTVRLEADADSVGIGTASPQAKLDVSGDIRASDSLLADQLCLGTALTSGGTFRLYGQLTADPIMEAYESSGSGFFKISGDDSTIFDMSSSGDSSVMLPAASISDTEIENEAGIGNIQRTNGSVVIGYAVTTVLSRKMDFPSDGYALVIATGNLAIAHTQNTEDGAFFGVSNTNLALPSSQEYLKTIPGYLISADIYDIVTVHGYFNVNAGENWFYFLGQKFNGENIQMFDAELTVLFVPTSYEAASLNSKPMGEELKSKE